MYPYKAFFSLHLVLPPPSAKDGITWLITKGHVTKDVILIIIWPRNYQMPGMGEDKR
jgi:hypothetical protein